MKRIKFEVIVTDNGVTITDRNKELSPVAVFIEVDIFCTSGK